MLSFQTNQSQNPVNSSITNEKINKEEVHIKEASYEKVKEIKIDITLNEETPPKEEEVEEKHFIKEILTKAKEAYTSSWEDVQVYVRSYSGHHWEEEDAYVSTIGDLNDRNLETSNSKKKLVICDMARLEFGDEEIREALNFIETLPNELMREEILKKAVEYIIDLRKNQVGIPVNANKTEHEQLESSIVLTMNPLQKDRQEEISAPPSMDYFVNIAPPPLNRSNNNLNDEQESSIHSDNSRKVEVLDNNEGRQEESVELNKNITQIQIETESCMICFEDVPKIEFEMLLKCSHSFCKKCYIEHIKELMNNNKVLSITCPTNGCQEKFEDDHFAKVLDSNNFERYMGLKKGALLNQIPNLRWCIRPGCDKHIIGKKNSRKLVCQCGTKICFKCGNGYHFGKSCESIINQTYQKYAKDKNVQNCPQCKSRIEKNGGCNHMTCSRCHYQWCWLCGIKYTQDHFALSNANRCRKLQETMVENPSPVERSTYCSRICQEPILILGFPLFVLFLALFVPQWLYSLHKKKKDPNTFQNQSNSIEFSFAFLLLGIIFFPISLVLVLLLIIADAFVDFGLWICKKIFKKDFSARFSRVLEPQVL